MNKRMKTGLLLILFAVVGASTSVFAHCDTMDGPTIKDAQTALATKNVNHILKWVPASAEAEMRRVFARTLTVRKQGKDARELADAYLFDNLVRIHRASEGAPFSGVKPHGTPIDERVLAADKAIETGDLAPLAALVPAERAGELEKRFRRVMALKDYAVNDVAEGREYIEAYVQFFKFAEGEEDGHHADGHGQEEHGPEVGGQEVDRQDVRGHDA